MHLLSLVPAWTAARTAPSTSFHSSVASSRNNSAGSAKRPMNAPSAAGPLPSTCGSIPFRRGGVAVRVLGGVAARPSRVRDGRRRRAGMILTRPAK